MKQAHAVQRQRTRRAAALLADPILGRYIAAAKKDPRYANGAWRKLVDDVRDEGNRIAA